MTRTDVDKQLTETVRRRDQARDLLVRSFIEICTCEDRIDVLIDRKLATEPPLHTAPGARPEQPGAATP